MDFVLFGQMPASKAPQQRKKFTTEEDEHLKQLVEKYGCKKWEMIATEMPGRTGRQCRDRYRNYLVPGYFNGQWTQEEDDLLSARYQEMGPQWSKMTLFFPGRSANSLKNRWNYFVSRQTQSPIAISPVQVSPVQPMPQVNFAAPKPVEQDIFSSDIIENEPSNSLEFSIFDFQPAPMFEFEDFGDSYDFGF